MESLKGLLNGDLYLYIVELSHEKHEILTIPWSIYG